FESLNLHNIIFLICALHVLSYFFYLVYLFVRITRLYEINYTRFVWIILSVPTMGILVLCYGFFMGVQTAFHIGVNTLSITVILIYVFQAKYPDFFVTLKSDIKQKKYETTLLTEVNVEAIKQRLEELMMDKKLYLDDELRLNHLAEELGITSHQLSRILNESYNRNFNEFI